LVAFLKRGVYNKDISREENVSYLLGRIWLLGKAKQVGREL
jgi:hypothetical protein